jgi:predicted SprT family Zn-dependent metalloprotease
MNNLDGFDEFEQDDDFMIALQIQMQLDEDETRSVSKKEASVGDLALSLPSTTPRQPTTSSLMDPNWELVDPSPDIRALFQQFDKLYFWNRLGSCVVEWSKRMTICAGIFYLREGGIIRLSEPLLKYRPRHDLIQTLLHEMIHAYLYLTRNFKDRGEHGDEFKSHMNRINHLAKTNITVYHSFHDEVNHCRQHVWRCNGVCRQTPPFYGYVKRSMNRAPGKNDVWWSQHQSKCNGTFEKVSEPESFKAKQAAKVETKKSQLTGNVTIKEEQKSSSSSSSSKKEISIVSNNKKLDVYFNLQINSTSKSSSNESEKSKAASSLINKKAIAASSSDSTKTPEIEVYLAKKRKKPEESSKTASAKTCPDIILLDDDSDDDKDSAFSKKTSRLDSAEMVECPICFEKFPRPSVDYHVNSHF